MNRRADVIRALEVKTVATFTIAEAPAEPSTGQVFSHPR